MSGMKMSQAVDGVRDSRFWRLLKCCNFCTVGLGLVGCRWLSQGEGPVSLLGKLCDGGGKFWIMDTFRCNKRN